MSALYHFDEMLPTTNKGVVSGTDKRQVEVYDHEQKLYLRIGSLNAKNIHDEPYEVLLTIKSAEDIISAIQYGLQRSGPR